MIQTYKLEKNKKGEWNYVKQEGGFLCKTSDVNKLVVRMQDMEKEIKESKKAFKTLDEGLQRATIKNQILERLLKKNDIELPQGRQFPVENKEETKGEK